MLAETQAAGVSPSFLSTLGLNLKEYIAQLINFGVILLVMWKCVFPPLMRGLDERTKKIAKCLRDAEDAQTLKRTAEDERGRMIAEARKETKNIVDAARAQVVTERETMLKTAKQEVEKLVVAGKEQLRTEKESMMREAKSDLTELVITAVEKITKEKLDAHKDAKLLQEILS